MKLSTASLATLAVAALPLFVLAQATQPPPQDPNASVPRISQEDFKKLLAEDKVLVLDVRTEEAYHNGHVPGALSIPFGKLEERLQELKAAKKPIVAYCT
jgi:predicted sulfurtransferase